MGSWPLAFVLYQCFLSIVLLNLQASRVENISVHASNEILEQTTVSDYLRSTITFENGKAIKNPWEKHWPKRKKKKITQQSILETDIPSTTEWYMMDSLVPMLIHDIFKKSNLTINDSKVDDSKETADVNIRAADGINIPKEILSTDDVTTATVIATADDEINDEEQQSPSSSDEDIGPVVPCDYTDGSICWYNRQVGDSLTLAINVTNQLDEFYAAQWTRIYGSKSSRKSVRTKVDAEQCPWNAVFGSDGLELRLSPITDTDLDTNAFVAKLVSRNSLKNKKIFKSIKELTFRINVLPVDMGTISPGEDITINIENFLTIPIRGMSFEWGLEKGPDTTESLPSYMKISKSGKSVTVKDLKTGQGGVIMVCVMYSNSELSVAKRRFFIQRPKQTEKLVLTYNIEERSITDHKLECDSETPSTNSHSAENTMEPARKFQRFKGRYQRSNVEDYESDYFFSKPEFPTNDRNEEGTLFGTIPKEVHVVEPTMRIITHEDVERSAQLNPVLKIVYNCTSNYDCGPKASCIYPKRDEEEGDNIQVLQGFCRCNSEYQGDGRRCHRPSNFHHRDKRIKRNIQPPFLNGRSNSAFMYPQETIPRQQQLFSPPQQPLPFVQVPPLSKNNQVYNSMDQSDLKSGSAIDRSDSGDDEDSSSVATCDSRDYCSPHAICIKNEGVIGYCKCTAGFRGNGIFCWEIPDYVAPIPSYDTEGEKFAM